MDFNWLTNPNMLQYMGNAGAKLQAGENWGAALNPSNTLRNIQMQKALSQGGKGSAFDYLLNPTPKGMAGPDSVTIKKTADGTTLTSTMPSEENLNTYGTSVPPEATPAAPSAGGVSDQTPFWEMLLGLQGPYQQ